VGGCKGRFYFPGDQKKKSESQERQKKKLRCKRSLSLLEREKTFQTGGVFALALKAIMEKTVGGEKKIFLPTPEHERQLDQHCRRKPFQKQQGRKKSNAVRKGNFGWMGGVSS